MTLAALTGIISFDEDKPFLQEIYGFATSVIQNYLSASNKGKYVILVLEGNFGSRTRTKKMIMEGLQRSISKKLKWLNCKVSVVDSYTYNSRFFKIRTCAEEETDRI